NRIVWMIIAAIVRLLLLDCRALHILQPSHYGIPIGMYLESGGFLFLQQQSPRRIQTGFYLFNDNLLLCFKLFGIKAAVDYPVGFDFQRHVPSVGREIEIVRSEIMRRERIVAAS